MEIQGRGIRWLVLPCIIHGLITMQTEPCLRQLCNIIIVIIILWMFENFICEIVFFLRVIIWINCTDVVWLCSHILWLCCLRICSVWRVYYVFQVDRVFQTTEMQTKIDNTGNVCNPQPLLLYQLKGETIGFKTAL